MVNGEVAANPSSFVTALLTICYFLFAIYYHYCPNVDRLIVCILLYLIDLTPMHVGIDFNSLRRKQPTLSRDWRLESVVGHLFAKICYAQRNLDDIVYTFMSVLIVMVVKESQRFSLLHHKLTKLEVTWLPSY